jgi:pyruvate dehydrogenase E1 component beta subunit/2-oxoisovalerate dehydrogenase E1 component
VIRRPGRNVTLISWSYSLWKTLDAAEVLAKEGIEAEVIDLRSLRPLDEETLTTSVRRTRRAIVADEGRRTGSLSAEIAARLQEACFWHLDAPIRRVCATEVPVPYPKHLETAALPQLTNIIAAVKALPGVGSGDGCVGLWGIGCYKCKRPRESEAKCLVLVLERFGCGDRI